MGDTGMALGRNARGLLGIPGLNNGGGGLRAVEDKCSVV